MRDGASLKNREVDGTRDPGRGPDSMGKALRSTVWKAGIRSFLTGDRAVQNG